jgi:hypothetical protein
MRTDNEPGNKYARQGLRRIFLALSSNASTEGAMSTLFEHICA